MSHPSPEKILQTGLAFWPAKTLLSAIEIGVFTELAQRARLPGHARRTRVPDTRGRSLRQRARHRSVPRPAQAVVRWRRPRDGQSQAWGHLTEALRTGQPQNELKGGGPALFETLYADPARLEQFLAAMTGISHGANMTIARQFPWKDHRTVVDARRASSRWSVRIRW